MRPFVLAATLSLAALPALAEDLVFTLENTSSYGLVELYVAPHSSDTWGEDILAGQTVASGESGDVTISDGDTTCDYDLRFVMDNGATVDGNQDLCLLETFTLHD